MLYLLVLALYQLFGRMTIGKRYELRAIRGQAPSLLPMRTIAERLFFRMPATAQGDPISDFKGLPVGPLDGDVACHPEGSGDGAL